MRILLTNDDGIDAPGLLALYQAVRDLGEVHVVAPSQRQSAAAHAITIHEPIATRPHRCWRGGQVVFEGIAVDGRPADCVKLAMTYMTPRPIDLVLSGMNAGANVGINVIYSGTVAAAMEAAFMGTPSVAVSLDLGASESPLWDAAAAHARRALDGILAHPLEPHAVLNLNIPRLDHGAAPGPLRVVPISTSPLVEQYAAGVNAAGEKTFHASKDYAFRHTPADSDVDALAKGFITLTPLHFDLTDHGQVRTWRRRFQ